VITPEAERRASLLLAGLRRGLSGQLLLAELRRACLGIYLARCQTELAGRLRRGACLGICIYLARCQTELAGRLRRGRPSPG
jgi:hypothetical protein